MQDSFRKVPPKSHWRDWTVLCAHRLEPARRDQSEQNRAQVSRIISGGAEQAESHGCRAALVGADETPESIDVRLDVKGGLLSDYNLFICEK